MGKNYFKEKFMSDIKIIKADESHFEQIWQIFHEVIQAGDSYVYDPSTNKEQARSIWMNQPGMQTYVALIDDKVAGTYIIKPNFIGNGSHVANCSYMVNKETRKCGVGRLMGGHSIGLAKQEGFLSMQFNIVVSSNNAAVKLWQ